jgi:hypothetical protein
LDGITDCLRAVASKRRTVLLSFLLPMAGHPRQVEQQCETRLALHESSDRRTAEAYNEITLPVAWNCPVRHLGGAVADEELWCNK